MTALFRSKQGFSLAWAPKGHGIVERAHRELHKGLGQALETIAGAQGSHWPRFVPLVEMVW